MLPAQLIFDFGIGVQGGVFRLSNDRSFYEVDSIRNHNFEMDSTENFVVKPGDGATFGITGMVACTLTSPDQRIFYTATVRPSVLFSSFQMYTPNFNHSQVPPDIKWYRDSLKPSRAGVFTLPVIAHVNYNMNAQGDVVYFGAGVSVNLGRVDRRKEFNHVETVFVADNISTPERSDDYAGFYMFRAFYKVETQVGFIWTGRNDRQREAYIAASFGKGKQGSLLIGYLWRFNFYNPNK